ncbi:Branched-chain amino acid transport protein [Bacillus sp. OV322]|uniref:AzlD domain-containing protein n=1 Tax=Bacillus sp. OV322 TaxID=1882764 RepID=UPI0008F061CB|nr:AzlD domain-containing protein [Bacillus sp. OV322]SFB96144.1 Branched-chain amino acid transport protein [Bacillus sp. OV322]
MHSKMIYMIIAMGAVTYIPRFLPFVLFKGKELPPFLQGVLKNIPFATLGALIFPGILLISHDLKYGLTGAAAAFILAWYGTNVIVVIVGAIAALSIYSMIF